MAILLNVLLWCILWCILWVTVDYIVHTQMSKPSTKISFIKLRNYIIREGWVYTDVFKQSLFGRNTDEWHANSLVIKGLNYHLGIIDYFRMKHFVKNYIKNAEALSWEDACDYIWGDTK